MKNRIYVSFVLLAAIIGVFILPMESHGESLVDENSALQEVWLGEDIQVSCYMKSYGYWGWAFVSGETAPLQGREYIKTSQTHMYIKSKIDNSIYHETHAYDPIGWGVTSMINNSFYDKPANSESYYLEAHHQIQDARTDKWYSFVQRKHIIYTPEELQFYENDGGFVSVIK